MCTKISSQLCFLESCAATFIAFSASVEKSVGTRIFFILLAFNLKTKFNKKNRLLKINVVLLYKSLVNLFQEITHSKKLLKANSVSLFLIKTKLYLGLL